MPFGLKSIWFQLATELAVIAWFLTRFSNKYAAGDFDGPRGARRTWHDGAVVHRRHHRR